MRKHDHMHLTAWSRGFLWLVLAMGVAGRSVGQQVEVELAHEWTALFDRNSGWTGADGIYSIPLNGDESPLEAGCTPTLFVFSDTFVGEVNNAGERVGGSTLVNNTLAIMGRRDAHDIEFLVKEEDGTPAAMFVPETPASRPGDWYWLSDGVAIGPEVNIFALRMTTGDGGEFNFAIAGVSLISLQLDAEHPVAEARQVDTPLYLPATEDRGDINFGGAIMPNTADAGAPDPDGYLYVYGTQNDPFVKRLVAARVTPATFHDFSTWQYYTSGGWGSNIGDVAPLTGRISSEFSVTPMPDGRYILVFQLDTLGRDVAFRTADSPLGPWGPIQRIYTCPEPDLDADIFVYNAKAHPHLSAPGELLISYNVNTFDFWDHFRYADIYRPRFIRLRLRAQ